MTSGRMEGNGDEGSNASFDEVLIWRIERRRPTENTVYGHVLDTSFEQLVYSHGEGLPNHRMQVARGAESGIWKRKMDQ